MGVKVVVVWRTAWRRTPSGCERGGGGEAAGRGHLLVDALVQRALVQGPVRIEEEHLRTAGARGVEGAGAAGGGRRRGRQLEREGQQAGHAQGAAARVWGAGGEGHASFTSRWRRSMEARSVYRGKPPSKRTPRVPRLLLVM